MKPLSALIVIDVQNDFLSPGGAFPKRHLETQQLCKTISWLAEAARQQQRHIVWVTSSYGEVTESPERLKGKTHTGKPCCLKNSWGSEIVIDLQSTFAKKTDAEIHIIKHWYNAFEQTNLHQWLQDRNISEVSLCGVTTDICVFHTAQAASRLGYTVEILEGATAASTQGKHLVALRSLLKLGIQTKHWGELLSEGKTAKLTGIAGDSILHCASLSSCIDESTFKTLNQEIDWHQMSHRGSSVPRLIALQGTKENDGVEPLYRHPADEQPPLINWTPTVDSIRKEVENRIGHPLNHCLIQLYRNGRDWIGKHADKTLDIKESSFIVNISIGVMRTMVFRPKSDRNSNPQKLPLPHGSLFMLSRQSNRDFYHEIEKQGSQGTDKPRISLTFRYIGTYYDSRNGAVWGIGSPSKTREEANKRASELKTLSSEERLAKEKEEAEKMVALFREENISDHFDANLYQPGFEILNFRGLLD